jgi:hypothetical protein
MNYLCLELEGSVHGQDFGFLRVQQAVLSEVLKGQLTALFWRFALLPAFWNLALLLLDTIVLYEVIESQSSLVLFQCLRRTFRPALSLRVRIKAT